MSKESRYFLIGLITLFALLAIVMGLQFLNSVLLGVILAVLMFPVYNRLKLRFGGHMNLAALATLTATIALIIIPATFLSVLVAREGIALFNGAEEYASSHTLQNTLSGITPLLEKFNITLDGTLQEKFFGGLQSLGLYLSQNLGGLFSGAASLFLGFFIMSVTIFYFLRDGRDLGNIIIHLSPLDTADEVNLYETFRKVLGAVFYGNIVSATVQGALGGLGFLIFGIGAPVLWGAVMAFLALIPLLGPYIIFIPAAIYLFIAKGFVPALIFVIYNILIVSSIDNIIKPKIIGSKIKIHPFIILMSILGGLATFGLIGIIYGPIITSILLALIDIYLRSEKSRTLFKEN